MADYAQASNVLIEQITKKAKELDGVTVQLAAQGLLHLAQAYATIREASKD